MSPAALRRALRSAPLQVFAAVGVAAFLATAVPQALSRAFASMMLARTFRGESVSAAPVRTWGARYWAGVERARSAIPRNGAYLLATEKGSGSTWVFLRYDLAPRRAFAIGEVAGAPTGQAGRPPDAPDWVVIAQAPGRSPRLVASKVFFHDAARDLVPGRRDDSIPCNVDDPANGATTHEPVVLRGWCQELGGRPCSAPRIVFDGEERAPDTFERFPRPDVASAVRGIGNCDRAGFRATYLLGDDAAGEHVATVFFLTEDGRYRPSGAIHFAVEGPQP
jgi:hypothetical protein